MLISGKVSMNGFASVLLVCSATLFFQECVIAIQNPPTPPTQDKTQPAVAGRETVTVKANFTPEEKEDWKINEVYQKAYEMEKQQDFGRAISKLRSDVIPLAEKSTFEVPRKKFLYFAYRDLGDCDISTKQYGDAELMYQKALDYRSAGPDQYDLDGPILLRSIGLAQMGQQNWSSADATLANSVTALDAQIERAVHPKSERESVTPEDLANLRNEQDLSMDLLAVTYFREKRITESLAVLDRAYLQATQFNAPAKIVARIVNHGVDVSTAAGNASAIAVWTYRALTAK